MPINDVLDKPLQESLLALLAYNDEQGGVVAKLLDPSSFEGDYAEIARRCIHYHLTYKRSPGIHIDDLFGDMLARRDDNKHITYRHVLTNLMKVREEGINVRFLLDKVKEFTRLQKTRQVLLDASQRLSSRQEKALDEVDSILEDLLRARRGDSSIGMRLTEIDRLFDHMKTRRSEFKIGIEQLDKADVCPVRGGVMLVLGPSGGGKSWFLVHLGKVALSFRYKVLHVTLEMSEEQVTQRYLQSMFTVSTKDIRTKFTHITEEKDEETGKTKPGFEFDNPMPPQFRFFNEGDENFNVAREELQARFEWLGKKVDNLVIKRWAPSFMGARELSAHLDMLEMAEHFSPDLVIVDYLGLMKLNRAREKEYRHALGQALVDLRAIAVERNLAMVVAQQVSREGAQAKLTENVHVAEDWSLIGTSDCILTLSATNAEKTLGLCRVFVSKSRDERDKFGVLISQNYSLGQFVIDSTPMYAGYDKALKEALKNDPDQKSREDEEANDEGE